MRSIANCTQSCQPSQWQEEDLEFRTSDPENYKAIAKKLREKRSAREHCIQSIVKRVRSGIKGAGMQGQVSGRPKHIFSIYSKMRRARISFRSLHDLRGIRIIVACRTDCYLALGVIHAIWPQAPEAFDDYIASPKANGYRSLHTTVVHEDGKTVEVQIRTLKMHEIAENGSAAHWRYKNPFRNMKPFDCGLSIT